MEINPDEWASAAEHFRDKQKEGHQAYEFGDLVNYLEEMSRKPNEVMAITEEAWQAIPEAELPETEPGFLQIQLYIALPDMPAVEEAKKVMNAAAYVAELLTKGNATQKLVRYETPKGLRFYSLD